MRSQDTIKNNLRELVENIALFNNDPKCRKLHNRLELSKLPDLVSSKMPTEEGAGSVETGNLSEATATTITGPESGMIFFRNMSISIVFSTEVFPQQLLA